MKLRRVKKWGRVRWRLNWHEGGRQHRHFFATRAEAEKFAAAQAKVREDYGRGWLALDATSRAEVMAAFEKAWAGGYTLLEACDVFERHRGGGVRPAEISKAVSACLESKAQQNLRRSSLSKLKRSLERLSAVFSGRKVDQVGPEDLERYLGQWQSAATRKSIRTDLQTFFGWARDRGLCAENPVGKVEVPILEDRAPRILNVAQARQLMEAAARMDRGMCSFFSLGLFAGIRPAELLRLSPAEVQLDEAYVEVPGHKAKTRARRIVELSENCVAWCRLGLELPPRNWRKRFDAVRIAAGLLGAWSHDVMRHSAASYHLARHGQADLTATMLGHEGSRMLYRHYRELVRPAEAEKFFRIMPRLSVLAGGRGQPEDPKLARAKGGSLA